jgi:AcrR family transcriptional regulator
MPNPSPTPDASDLKERETRARIREVARKRFFSDGYSALTMDDLAAELGMSKKTLYVYFPSKDDLLREILQEFVAGVRTLADTLFNDASLSFTVKLHRFSEAMTHRLQIHQYIFRDLQRAAPHIFQLVEELRHKNIPYVFGQMIRQGQKAGMVQPDVDPELAIEFWRPALQSLMHPDTLERLHLQPAEMFKKATKLFFGGLLTPAGRKDYEKNLED